MKTDDELRGFDASKMVQFADILERSSNAMLENTAKHIEALPDDSPMKTYLELLWKAEMLEYREEEK